LAFRGGWLDLAYTISGIWALGPKLQFQKYRMEVEDNGDREREEKEIKRDF
jgi:hypothetical protein